MSKCRKIPTRQEMLDRIEGYEATLEMLTVIERMEAEGRLVDPEGYAGDSVGSCLGGSVSEEWVEF